MNDLPNDEQTSNSTRRSRLLAIAKVFIILIVLIGLAWTCVVSAQQWRAQPTLSLEALNWPLLCVAAGLYGVGISSGSLVLRQALLSLDQRPAWQAILAAQLIGHLGKYVPGKAMVVVLRAGVLVPQGVAAIPATIAVFVETLTMLAVGSALGCSVVFAVPLPHWIRVAAIAMAIAATSVTLPPVLRWITGRLVRSKVEIAFSAGWKLLLVAWFWTLVSWCFIGASFATVILAIPTTNVLPPIAELAWLATATIALAFSIGFVSMLPGGVGVRELVITSMLASVIGMPHALASSIMLRLLFVVVEVVLATVASRWLRPM